MSTKRYVYTAWFRDTLMPPDDQDYEWPACFLIEASTSGEALAWGDHLARGYSARMVTEVYLSSHVEDADSAESDLSRLPVVPVGYEALDREIGW